MEHLDTFQRNNLLVGTRLAVEIAASSPELRAFVVVGTYTHSTVRPRKPSRYLNKSEDDLLFWIRKYEVARNNIEKDITNRDLVGEIYVKDIESIGKLEKELGKYVDDFSLMKPDWYVDNPL